MLQDYVFVGKKYDPSMDADLFVDDHFFNIEDEWFSMAHLVVHIGVFSSISQAKKNGWDKEIPFGWTEFKLPKKFGGAMLIVWNPKFNMSEWRDYENKNAGN